MAVEGANGLIAAIADAHSLEAAGDRIAAAAELVMGKVVGIPVAILRGHSYRPGDSGQASLLRERSMDLFR